MNVMIFFRRCLNSIFLKMRVGLIVIIKLSLPESTIREMIFARYSTHLVRTIGSYLHPWNMTVLDKIPKGLIITSKHKIHRINNPSRNLSKKDMIRYQLKIWLGILLPSFPNVVGVEGVYTRSSLQNLLIIGKNRLSLTLFKKNR